MADQRHSEPPCPDCDTLKVQLETALHFGDLSEAVDLRVLLRRHPRHDDTPVASERKHA